MVLKKWGISHLYNWIQKDPIIDYLELYHSNKKYCPPSNYDFEALQTRSNISLTDWKQSILNCIENRCQEIGDYLVDRPVSVLHEIEKYTKGISNGYICMKNEYATIDLILHKQLLSYLPYYNNQMSSNDLYTLCFWNNTKTPSLYMQCKISFAWKLFERLTMRSARCILIFPEGILTIDPIKYMNIIEDGRQWLTDLYEEGSFWSIDSLEVPDLRLLPNLGRRNPGWDKLKEQLAIRWNEVSLVCHIGVKIRDILHSNQIYSLLDPRIISCIDTLDQVPSITKHIIEEFQCKKGPLSSHLPLPVLSFEETIISVDIESVSGLWHDGTKAGDIFIGALLILPSGVVQQYIFFNSSFEKVLNKFYMFLSNYQDALLIHYTDADLSVIPKGFRTLDIHPLVRDAYENSPFLRSFKMYKFGLKHVTGCLFGDLYESSMIKNGCECSAALYNAVRMGISSPDGQLLFSQVEEYNSIDLYALAYLFKTLLSVSTIKKYWRTRIEIKK
jgi:hypothetical protein